MNVIHIVSRLMFTCVLMSVYTCVVLLRLTVFPFIKSHLWMPCHHCWRVHKLPCKACVCECSHICVEALTSMHLWGVHKAECESGVNVLTPGHMKQLSLSNKLSCMWEKMSFSLYQPPLLMTTNPSLLEKQRERVSSTETAKLWNIKTNTLKI